MCPGRRGPYNPCPDGETVRARRLKVAEIESHDKALGRQARMAEFREMEGINARPLVNFVYVFLALMDLEVETFLHNPLLSVDLCRCI